MGCLLLLIFTGCNGSRSATIQVLDRTNPIDTLLQARILIDEGKAQAALDLLGDSDAWSSADHALLAGLAHQELNRPGAAKAAFEQAKVLDPDALLPYLRIGVLAYTRGDLDMARDHLFHYLKGEKGNPEAWYYLYMTNPDAPEAAEAARKVVALDGKDAFWSRKLREAMER